MPTKKKSSPATAPDDFDIIRLPKKLITAPEPEPLPEAEYMEVSVAVDDLNDADEFTDRLTRMAIVELTTQIDAYDVEMDDIAERRKTLEGQLATLLDEKKVRSVAWGDFSLSWIYSANTRLDPDLLIMNGVPSSLIAACKRSKSIRYFKLTNVARAAAERERKKQEKAEQAGESNQ